MRGQRRIQCLLLVACFSLLTIACDALGDVESTGSGGDAPLKSYQIELLDIAFEAASAVPADPHIKSRSRAQETVVTACLELKQPRRALRYIEQIDNWRRGAAFADLALYCAQHGAMEKKAESYLNKAAQVAERTEDWRRDQIEAKIAKVRGLLGKHDKAEKAARTQTLTCPPDSFDEEIRRLDTIVSAGNFDLVRGAFARYIELYNCLYTDTERRKLIEARIQASWGKMPSSIRINLLAGLADCAADHEDRANALRLITEAKAMMDSSTWQLRSGIPLRAALAELRFRSGGQEDARTELQNALEMFEANRQRIVNIDRAGILRSIAEAYQAIGDIKKARDLYRLALEAGVGNPNSRPRAEDLTATCCSMALRKVEPGAELWDRIRKIHGSLGDPW